MLELLAAALFSAASPASPESSAVDTSRARRIVRMFTPIEVTGTRVSDAGAVSSVHSLLGASIRQLPVDRLIDAIALMPGVVAIGEELHVRGGRNGEAPLSIGGVPLEDPQFGGAFELPLFAVHAADLMTGPVDADRAGTLAGEIDVQTEAPTPVRRARLRWLTDAGASRGDDLAQLGWSGPVPRTPIGFAVAADASLSNQQMPNFRGLERTNVLGAKLGWRADNHFVGWARIAPVAHPRRASLDVLASRVIRAPFDPMFTHDGYVTYNTLDFDNSNPGTPWVQLTPEPVDSTSFYYRAADHVVMTDERKLALVGQATFGTRAPAHLAAGLLHTSSLTSVGLSRTPDYVRRDRLPLFGPYDRDWGDPFHALDGDEPYFRDASASRAFGRADFTLAQLADQRLRFGLGGAWDHVKLYEIDIARPQTTGVDSVRFYSAGAPSGFAYVQHRFEAGGLVLNDGLRLQVFDAGAQAPGSRAMAFLSPRLGIAYPVSARDAFSFAYARIEQDPPRDFLYDERVNGYNRRPLGNPLMQPAEVVVWQAALKHILDPQWSAQVGVFARDVFGEPGLRAKSMPDRTYQLEYADIDDAHTSGVELDLSRTLANGGVMHWSWTFMHAWGRESSPDGLPFGEAFGARTLPTGQHPLDWDLQNMLGADGLVRPRRGLAISWSSRLATGRPWTPLYRDDYTAPLWPPLYASQEYVNTRRMRWSEYTNVDVRYTSPWLRGATLRCEVRNLFDHRGDVIPTLSGYPNPLINTLYDEYSAYRTETGNDGGGYWNGDGTTRRWFPIDDPRLSQRPREIRIGFSIGE